VPSLRFLIPATTLFIACAATLGLGLAGPSHAAASPATLDILSSRPDLVSGGEVVFGLPGTSDADLKVVANGAPLTARFAVVRGKLVGVASGLPNGTVHLSVLRRNSIIASSDLVVHPAGSPLLYPRIMPWVCDPGALDADCNRPAVFNYFYKGTGPGPQGLRPYDPARPAADVATATTATGAKVPFIVRIETGVIDRDWYNIAVLFDPTKAWDALAPQPAWNGKLLITHGAGYGLGFGQFATTTSYNVRNLHALEKGFAVASTALGDNGHNGNIAVQAEATSLLKEHFVKAYGPIRYTIAMGGSGGSLTSYSVANAYPGLFDGLVVGASFPDDGSSLVEVEDCALLNNYFGKGASWGDGVRWTPAQVLAAEGHLRDVCSSWGNQTHTKAMGVSADVGFTQILQPSHIGTVYYPGIAYTAIGGCDAPPATRYIRAINPKGVRCTAQDYIAEIVGRRREDGFAKLPYGNIGVQYGLVALNAGTISVDQFLDLNAKIGSHNIDNDLQPGRARAEGVAAAYRSGFVNEAVGLTKLPIIDIRTPDLDSIHHQFRSWSARARIDRVQGNHRNQVIWYGTKLTFDDGLDAMDAWLDRIGTASRSASIAQRIAAARPATLTDLCATRNGDGLSMEQCTGANDGSVRMGAGGALTDDVIACKLIQPERSAYRVTFTDEQWARLRAIFTEGVCNYAVPGEEQQPAQPWQAYLASAERP